MNDVALVEHKHQLVTLWITYCLYLLTIPAILGVVINWIEIKKADQFKKENNPEFIIAMQILDSHHQWLVRTFIFCFVFSLAAVGTSYYGVGYVVAGVTVIWWFYRVLKGMIMLSSNKPMPL